MDQNDLIPAFRSPGFLASLQHASSPELMPQVSIGLQSGDSGGVRHLYVIFLEKLIGTPGNMLWIVVLHEPMLSTDKVSSDEWNKATLKYGHIEVCIHNSSKNGNTGGTLFADSGPNMYFGRVFWAGLWFWLLSFLPVAPQSMGFDLDRCFITEQR